MPTLIQINGRYVIPTQENIDKINNAKLPKELMQKTNLPIDLEVKKVTTEELNEVSEKVEEVTVEETTIIEEVKEDNLSLIELREEYKKKFNKKPFNWRTAEEIVLKLKE